MQSVLTKDEKEFMLFLNAHERIQRFDGRQTRLFESIKKKGIVGREGWTNRGVVHLVVDCNVPFMELKAKFPKQLEEKKDINRLSKFFGDKAEWLNIFYYYKHRQYIEWDLFNEQNNCTYDKLDFDSIQKLSFLILEKLIDDGRIPLDKLLPAYGVPEHIVKHTDRSLIKEAIKQYHGY